jgi:aminobenzoyl-glutamate utilization protein B
MIRHRLAIWAIASVWGFGTAATAFAAPPVSALKSQSVTEVEARAKLAQEINDSLFSFSELAFQEYETAKYLTDILEKEGFAVQRNVAGLPTGWVARWTNGSGGPVIALGSDIDGIPKANQKPGIPWREPLVAGAPGHGEGHNSGP